MREPAIKQRNIKYKKAYKYIGKQSEIRNRGYAFSKDLWWKEIKLFYHPETTHISFEATEALTMISFAIAMTSSRKNQPYHIK